MSGCCERKSPSYKKKKEGVLPLLFSYDVKLIERIASLNLC